MAGVRRPSLIVRTKDMFLLESSSVFSAALRLWGHGQRFIWKLEKGGRNILSEIELGQDFMYWLAFVLGFVLLV